MPWHRVRGRPWQPGDRHGRQPAQQYARGLASPGQHMVSTAPNALTHHHWLGHRGSSHRRCASLVRAAKLPAKFGRAQPSASHTRSGETKRFHIYTRSNILYIWRADLNKTSMPSMCIWRADLDAMVRAEFSSIFAPAELAVYRDSVGGTGWPPNRRRPAGQGPQYTLTPLGTASPSPSPSPPRHPSPSALLATLAPPRTLHPPPRIGLIHLTFHTLHTLHTPQVLFVLTGDIPTRLAYLDHFSYSASEPTSYNTSEPTEFSGAFFSEFTPGYPEVLMEATTPPPPLPPTRR